MANEFDISLRKRGDDDVRLRRGPEIDLAERAAVLSGDRRVPIPAGGLQIGRDSACELQLMSGLVAPQHARIEVRPGGSRITDLGSRTGVYVNGEHFVASSRPLRSGDSIAIGDEVLYFVTTDNAPLPPVEVPRPHSQLRMDRAQLRLGRDPSNDIVLDHPTVSPEHAEIASGPSGARIKDLSRGGAGVRINGRLVSRGFLKTGDEIAIGPFRFVFDGELLQQRAVDRGLRLDAEGLHVDIGDKTILQPTSLTMMPGELVAVIGPSGAGKSTLLKCLCGVNAPTAGRVTVDGEPVHGRIADLGYVPQDEIVHPLLTVREALGYAAELRLPQDMREEDRLGAVSRVLEEVGLVSHAETLIEHLSGGQRKRAGVATELISQPGLLFLDEPTTGLDPGLEVRLMALFRSLAEAGRATMVVTHATRSLRLCDKVVVMGEGGYMCFAGTPEDALEFFEVEHFDDLYMVLEEQGAASWAQRFQDRAHRRLEILPSPPAKSRVQPPRPLGPQALTLIRRRVTILARDTRNLWILGLQVPIIGLLLALLFSKHVFVHGDGLPMTAGLSGQLLFLLVTVALWFGALASAREIVRERGVVQRETAVGVRIPAYLLSKAVVLCTLTGVQTIVLTALVLALRPLHETPATTLLVVSLLVLTAWAGIGMGLLVSVSVGTEDQAASFIPLLLIPQLLFGGTVMPVHQMGAVLKVLSKVIVAQWAYAGVGNAVHMNSRVAQDRIFSSVSRYGNSFFALPASVAILVLLAFCAGAALLLDQRLRRTLRIESTR
jgi:ABC-type multidrug transport system ATPase subunit/pSer/pThr/pTyr-binding forkhead associated (FHA) protein